MAKSKWDQCYSCWRRVLASEVPARRVEDHWAVCQWCIDAGQDMPYCLLVPLADDDWARARFSGEWARQIAARLDGKTMARALMSA